MEQDRVRIVAVGYAGEGNLGDDYLAARLASLASAALPDTHVAVAWGGASPWEPPEVEVVGRDLSAVFDAIESADGLVIGPGGILHNARGFGNRHRDRGLAYYDAVTAKAASRGVPVGAIGVGVGPLVGSAARRMTKRILERCATVSVRDEHAAQILADLGVTGIEVVPDLAINPSIPSREDSRAVLARDGATLGVCVRPWIDEEETRRVSSTVAAAIDLLVDAGHVTNVVGVPLSSSPIEALDDRWPTIATLDAVTSPVSTRMLEVVDFTNFERDFAELDVMVSMRLHGVILARNVGTPSLGIEYDEKVRTATAGLGAETVSLTADAATIAEAVRTVLAEGRSVPTLHAPGAAGAQIRALRAADPPRTTPRSAAFRHFESLLLAAGA